MKTYEDMAHDVFRAIDAYETKKQVQRKRLTRAAAAVGGVGLAALVGLGVWQSDVFRAATPPASSVTVDDPGTGSHAAPDVTDPSVPDSNDVNQPVGEPTAPAQIKPMIEAYGNMASPVYVTPTDGKTGYSVPLSEAMGRYGDTVTYRVIVQVFQNERQLEAADEAVEAEGRRLAEAGYVVAWETARREDTEQSYFSLHATADQLTNFPAGEAYGYMLLLYGEIIEPAGEMQPDGAVWNYQTAVEP